MSNIYGGNDLQAAIGKAVAGDTVVQNYDTRCPVITLKSGITLRASMDSRIFGRVVGMGVHDVTLQDLEILHSPLSGVWLEGCSNIKALRCRVRDYNTTDTNGHGGFVAHGKCSEILYDQCESYLGCGNGFRNTYSADGVPTGVSIINCAVWGTKGQSSEGMTVGCHTNIEGCRIQAANTWGILAWTDANGPVLDGVHIASTYILNSSQSLAGTHSAVCLEPNGGKIRNVFLCQVTADDSQASQTQSRFLMCLTSGTIENLIVKDNHQFNQLSPNPVVIVPTVKLINPNIDMPISAS